jgi:hypothetical protein
VFAINAPLTGIRNIADDVKYDLTDALEGVTGA